MSGPDRYAVMGNPITHSRSPEIHALFARQTRQSMRYDAILVDRDRFAQAVAGFVADGGKGLNVTLPFKQEACRVAGELSERARRAGAVNTLVVSGRSRLFGDNTDGIGLVRDLTTNLHIGITDSRVLLLGAGGAARGALAPLLEHQPARLVIANRTAARALELADLFSDLGRVAGCSFGALRGQRFDLVINATAAGLQGQVPDLPEGVIGSETCCYDMTYGTGPTAFMRFADAQGARCSYDGLGMLVEQAAESFRLWRGVQPETGTVIDRLRTR